MPHAATARLPSPSLLPPPRRQPRRRRSARRAGSSAMPDRPSTHPGALLRSQPTPRMWVGEVGTGDRRVPANHRDLSHAPTLRLLLNPTTQTLTLLVATALPAQRTQACARANGRGQEDDFNPASFPAPALSWPRCGTDRDGAVLGAPAVACFRHPLPHHVSPSKGRRWPPRSSVTFVEHAGVGVEQLLLRGGTGGDAVADDERAVLADAPQRFAAPQAGELGALREG
jgi:hypothetical protein